MKERIKAGNRSLNVVIAERPELLGPKAKVGRSPSDLSKTLHSPHRPPPTRQARLIKCDDGVMSGNRTESTTTYRQYVELRE